MIPPLPLLTSKSGEGFLLGSSGQTIELDTAARHGSGSLQIM